MKLKRFWQSVFALLPMGLFTISKAALGGSRIARKGRSTSAGLESEKSHGELAHQAIAA
jgi:hypothetical protein